MSLRNVQRQAALYSELGTDLSSALRPQRLQHRTNELNTTARLLRNSRLFALPPPLPRPSNNLSAGIRATNASETATLPYPTRAAIVTTPASLALGDWGLKRSLPSKAFKTTTPVVRMIANDTMDHITEFESASDHVFTLQKLQEIDLTITTPNARTWSGRGGLRERTLSAFEESQDPKDIPLSYQKISGDASTKPRGWGASESAGAPADSQSLVRRWRYDAPWIAGMIEGEFEEYIRSTIKKKRVEFRDWLRARLSERQVDSTAPERKALDIDSGFDLNSEQAVDAAADKLIDEITSEAPSTEQVNVPPTKDELSDELLQLRARQRDLMRYVWEFLDLPGRFPMQTDSLSDYTNNLDIDQGPPTTHPSAGLSYLRSSNWLANHASLGPMQTPAPVQARVLQRGGRARNTLGVAGIAVDRHNLLNDDKDLSFQRLRNPGGGKTYVNVTSAQIDSKGLVSMEVIKAHAETAWAWGLANGSDNVDELVAKGNRDGLLQQQQQDMSSGPFARLQRTRSGLLGPRSLGPREATQSYRVVLPSDSAQVASRQAEGASASFSRRTPEYKPLDLSEILGNKKPE